MRQINGDWWPDRDRVCHQVAYLFGGADHAIALCKKRDLVIQAGGCIGSWPRYLRKTFQRVVTFEPSRENFELMLKNLSGVDVQCFNAALGSTAGRCGMTTNPKNCGDDRTTEGSEVDVLTIDSLLLSPDLIYLDIQGDEFSALTGAKETLERCSPVVGIEYDRGLKGKPPGDTQGFLESFGYRLVKRYKQDLIFAR